MKKILSKHIIFTRTPLKSHFRFGEEFQIYPYDIEEAPKSQLQLDFPVMLEYWYDDDEVIELTDEMEEYDQVSKFLTDNSKMVNKTNKITRLLSAITNHRFFTYTDKYESNGRWGTSFPNSEVSKESKWAESTWSIPWYQSDNIKKELEITEFSKQKHPDSVFIKHQEYYTMDPVESKDKTITFPETIYNTLHYYFNSEKDRKNILDSAIHLICNGVDLKLKMKSLSFLSFVSSIETLVNFEYKELNKAIEFECHDCQTIKNSVIKCKKCDRPIWGVKVKFKDFLKTYIAPSESSIKKYNKIYNLRSEIIHSGSLLLGDEMMNWKKSEKEDSQWMIHIETTQLARLSLVNWLITKSQM